MFKLACLWCLLTVKIEKLRVKLGLISDDGFAMTSLLDDIDDCFPTF